MYSTKQWLGSDSPNADCLRQPYELYGLHRTCCGQNKQQPTQTALYACALHHQQQQCPTVRISIWCFIMHALSDKQGWTCLTKCGSTRCHPMQSPLHKTPCYGGTLVYIHRVLADLRQQDQEPAAPSGTKLCTCTDWQLSRLLLPPSPAILCHTRWVVTPSTHPCTAKS